MQSNAIPLLVSLAGCPQRIPVLLGTIKEHSRKSLNRPPVAQCLLGDWGGGKSQNVSCGLPASFARRVSKSETTK